MKRSKRYNFSSGMGMVISGLNLKESLELDARLTAEIKAIREREKEVGVSNPEWRELFEKKNELRTQQSLVEIQIRDLRNIEKCLANNGSLTTVQNLITGASLEVADFRTVSAENFIFDADTILDDAIPPYIPIINEDNFRIKGYIFDAIRIAPDQYLLCVDKYVKNLLKGLILVTLDQMVLIQDYYFTKAYAYNKKVANERNQRSIQQYYGLSVQRRENFFAQRNFYYSLPVAVKKKIERDAWEALTLEEKEKLYIPVKIVQGKRLRSKLTENEMWISYHEMYESFVNPNAKIIKVKYANPEVFEAWKLFRNLLEIKLLDIRTQRQIVADTYGLSVETSFGESNTDSSLLAQYGIKVKRQNGDAIRLQEIEQIRQAYEQVCNTFGNFSAHAQLDGLKISHTGNKLVFASKSAGMFVPFYKTIAISAKFGEDTFRYISAHEFAHYYDHTLGKQKGKRFASDNYEDLPGLVASLFRKGMNQKSNSDYINCTHECFARAMEQYFATENDGENAVLVFNQSSPIDSVPYHRENNYCSKEYFKDAVKPIIQLMLNQNRGLFPEFQSEKPFSKQKIALLNLRSRLIEL